MMRADLAKLAAVADPRFGNEPEIVARLAQAGDRVYEVRSRITGAPMRKARRSLGVTACAFWHIVRGGAGADQTVVSE
jgi:hypothetical protein